MGRWGERGRGGRQGRWGLQKIRQNWTAFKRGYRWVSRICEVPTSTASSMM
ncbi:hypothetical protein [Tolypothrix sp. VBCCA 56010]|uniref:hypothetical protein n=1 Tax=Tolypothrix sp. VBCCA 56010 TaxID=3137731 RepID=UPI003D7D94B8